MLVDRLCRRAILFRDAIHRHVCRLWTSTIVTGVSGDLKSVDGRP